MKHRAPVQVPDSFSDELKQALTALESPVETVPNPLVQDVFVRVRLMERSPRMETLWEQRDELWPMIAPPFVEAGLPPALAHLAWPESNFQIDICSRRGARGLWQLMPATARNYGLKVSRRCDRLRGRGRNRKPACREDDERIDPPAATRAAARMLTELVHLSGKRDVLLAIAAYNVGPRKIQQQIKRQRIDIESQPIFWTLYERGALHRQSSQLLVGVLSMTVIAQRRNAMEVPPVAAPASEGDEAEEAATPATETSTAGEVSTSTQPETSTAINTDTGAATSTGTGPAGIEP